MKFTQNQKLGIPSDPYLTRWVLDLGFVSFRLHHWTGSDDLRHPHDHDWSFLTFVLYGSYIDRSPDGDEVMSVGKFAFRKAEHQHCVEVKTKHCWTFLITGPQRRKFGFWVNGKFVKRNKYFYEYGHHTKDQKSLRRKDY